jgi:rhodanese-related sulfurtransferase
MQNPLIRTYQVSIFFLVIGCFGLMSAKRTRVDYQCLPCGDKCDTAHYTHPGICPNCKMELVKSSTIRFQNIPSEQICRYLSSHSNAVLIDVRTKEEFEGRAEHNFGTLANAINIPIQEFDKRADELARYKHKQVILYCSHGHRSAQAAYKLDQAGFGNVVNMLGGISVVTDSACKR